MKEYYPIELFHWIAMGDKHIDYIEDILSVYPEYIHEKTKENYNCLILAAKLGNLEVVKFLVEKTDIDINHSTNEGNSLFYSITNKHTQISHYLIDSCKIDLKSKNIKGENILHIAAQNGNSSLLEKILLQEPRLNKEQDKFGNTPLHHMITHYKIHKNFIGASFLLENSDNETIMQKNNQNQSIKNIIDDYCSNQSKEYNTTLFTPLLNLIAV